MFGKAFYFITHFFDDGFRSRDADITADCHDPAEKLVADCNVDNGAEMIFIHRHDGEVLAETVDQDADHLIFGFHSDLGLFSAVHAEKAPCVAGQIKSLEFSPALSALSQNGDLQHLVDPVMLDL